MSAAARATAARVVPLAAWALIVWVLLTWTLTWSQLLFGAGIALVVGISLAPLGPVGAPWSLLRPRRAANFARLLFASAGRIVRANLSLARRVWLPSRPLRSGMVIVTSEMRSEGGLGAVGLISSLIVDNQIVDLDPSRHELQYHAVWIESEDPQALRAAINAPIERRLRAGGVR